MGTGTERNRLVPRRTARIAVGVLSVLVLGGWLFRATLYWRIPVAPGDPFGLGDVIELLFYFGVLGASALSLGAALLFAVFPGLRQWRSIAALVAAGLIAAPVFVLIHPHVPRLVGTPARRHP